MPTYALLDTDLYLPPPTLCTWGGGGDQKAQEKLASRSSLFLQHCRGRNWGLVHIFSPFSGVKNLSRLLSVL